MAIIESRLETEKSYENPDFGVKELADMIGTSQTRILELFRRSALYKTVDDYLDYLRLLSSMYYLMSQRSWGIAACAGRLFGHQVVQPQIPGCPRHDAS